MTGSAQESNVSKVQIQIVSSSCTYGDPACPSNQGTSLGSWLGPILLSAALVLAGLLAAMWVNVPWVRVLSVVGPVAFVAVAYLFGLYVAWFNPGGFFWPNVPG